jgi:hypothetical protein
MVPHRGRVQCSVIPEQRGPPEASIVESRHGVASGIDPQADHRGGRVRVIDLEVEHFPIGVEDA